MAADRTARPRAVRRRLARRPASFRSCGDARLHARCPGAAACVPRPGGGPGRTGSTRPGLPSARHGRPVERIRLASGVRHHDGRPCARRADGGLAAAPGRRHSRDRRTVRASCAWRRGLPRLPAVGRPDRHRAAPSPPPRTDRAPRPCRGSTDTDSGTPAGAQRTAGTHGCPGSSLSRAEASACPAPPARSLPCPRTDPSVRHTAPPWPLPPR